MHKRIHAVAEHLVDSADLVDEAAVVGDNYLGCAGRPAWSNGCKSLTTKK